MRATALLVVLGLTACDDPVDPGGIGGDAGTDAGDDVGDGDGDGDDDADSGSGGADGDDDGDDDDDDDDDDDNAQTGMEVYLSLCAPCHGTEAEGTDLGYELRHPDRDYSTWVVRNGRPGDEFPESAMAAFPPESVSDAQLEEIYDWLDSFPQPEGGEALYLDYCGDCHGADPWEGGVVGKKIGEKGLHDALERVRDGAGGSDYGARIFYMGPIDEETLSDDEVLQITEWFDTL